MSDSGGAWVRPSAGEDPIVLWIRVLRIRDEVGAMLREVVAAPDGSVWLSQRLLEVYLARHESAPREPGSPAAPVGGQQVAGAAGGAPQASEAEPQPEPGDEQTADPVAEPAPEPVAEAKPVEPVAEQKPAVETGRKQRRRKQQ